VAELELPRGMHPSRIDEKGRLKLPAGFQEYFNSLPEKKLFVTSLDRYIAQIYPISVWRENENFFLNYRENPRLAKAIAFNANDLGSDSEMDAQGRVLFSPELRRELRLENQPVKLCAHRGRIEIYSDGVYQAKKLQAAESTAEAVEVLERAGLK